MPSKPLLPRVLLSRLALGAAWGTALLPAVGCDNPDLDGDARTVALAAVKAYVSSGLVSMHAASVALQQAAPTPDADGWNSSADADAVQTMQSDWKDIRAGYERVEGAIAVLFPDLDAATDERYDGFIAEAADDNLFDGVGVTGVHAVERIVWSDQIPAAVVTFEQGLGQNYAPAAFPSTVVQATDFKAGLMARLVTDTQTMVDEFAPLALAPETAWRGVLGSLQEQFEKVSLAGTGEDESRYSQHTLADMRFNLEGGRVIFEAFEPLFVEQGDDGIALYQDILTAFIRTGEELDRHPGDAIPVVPSTWNPDAPSADDAASDYGSLFLHVARETDLGRSDSFISLFSQGADLLGIPQLAE